MKQQTWIQSAWTHAKRHTHRKPGDFWNLDGLYPTPDRQQLRRSPGWSSFTNWSQSFDRPTGAFYNAGLFDAPYYYFYGRIGAALSLIAYEGQGWNTAVTYSTKYTLALADYRLRELHQRNNLLWYGQDIFFISRTPRHVYKSANFGLPAIVYDATANDDASFLVLHGDRIYIVTETGQVWKSDSTASSFTQIFDPAPFLNFRYAVATSHYLLLFAHMENAAIQLFHLPLTNVDNVTPELLPIDTIPNVPGNHPIADQTRNHIMPWANNGEDIYFSSGHYPEFDNPRLDIYKYNGSRVQKIAEAHDLTNPTTSVYAFGLTFWHGELLLYQVGPTATWVRMLVGDRFVDFHELSSTSPWDTQASGYSALYNLAGTLFLTGINGSDEGFIHSKGYSDGHLITSWLDMDRPGHPKRLNRLTANIQGHCPDATVTIYYRVDGATAWTSAVATANAANIEADNLGVDFRRLQIKVAIADTSATPQDVRLDSISVRDTH
jgi:hypothetical protein